MEEDERYRTTVATVRRLFGVDAPLDPEPGERSYATDVRRLFYEHSFGDSWSRTGIDDRERSMLTVALLAVTGPGRAFRHHVYGALSLGITPAQLADVLIHVGVYAGVPKAHEAWDTVTQIVSRFESNQSK